MVSLIRSMWFHRLLCVRVSILVYGCTYSREGALSQDFAKFKILCLLLARLGGLGRCDWTLHAVAWETWLVLLTSYHGWTGAVNNRGVEGCNIILKRGRDRGRKKLETKIDRHIAHKHV